MGFIRGESRNQIISQPDSREDYIEDNNSARVIEAYINSLDLAALGFSRPRPHDAGRPMRDPKDLLKQWIYEPYTLVTAAGNGNEAESRSRPVFGETFPGSYFGILWDYT
jgi:hypothetical protein